MKRACPEQQLHRDNDRGLREWSPQAGDLSLSRAYREENVRLLQVGIEHNYLYGFYVHSSGLKLQRYEGDPEVTLLPK